MSVPPAARNGASTAGSLRRWGLAACLVLAVCLVLLSACAPASSAPELVLLISIDTLRADHLGCYGYPAPTSPHLDQLCREGWVFEKARSHAPSTLLAHASLFTSLWPHEHGASHVRGLALPPAATTLAEILAEEGWRTLALTGGGQLAPEFGLDQGFERYEALAPDFDLTVDRLLHHLANDFAEGPLFAFLHTYEVHHPYLPSAEHLERFGADYAGDLPDHISVELLHEINWGGRTISQADLAHIVATYDAEIRAVDEALGRLLAELDELGLRDETLLIVTSDHGEEFAERGRVGWHALTLYEEMLAVPLIFAGSSVPRGLRTSTLVGSVDVAPTLLDLLGIAWPASFRGRSLLPLARGEALLALEHVALGEIEQAPPFHSIRRGPWKLYEGSLFDLASDPLELADRSSQRPRLAGALNARLEALQEQPPPDAPEAEVSPATRQQLESLGYL
ncbi:MAG: sulfatase [Acidobacteriota bacterium]